jgi:hypothetical protein
MTIADTAASPLPVIIVQRGQHWLTASSGTRLNDDSRAGRQVIDVSMLQSP